MKHNFYREIIKVKVNELTFLDCLPFFFLPLLDGIKYITIKYVACNGGGEATAHFVNVISVFPKLTLL